MDPGNPDADNEYASKGYALSGKIMLSAVVILFFVVIVMVCLHLYARWYLLNTRRRRSRNRRTHLVFYVDPSNANPHHVTVPSCGLDATVLRTLPVFIYSSKTHPDSIECAVCLSELEENEPGRTLPNCNHSFHVECIDMWFHSHSTCPLCRSSVEAVPETTTHEINDIGSSSVLCVTCQHEADNPNVFASTSSFNARVGVTIQVPVRNGSFGDESVTESPSSYRSPMSRMLSFRRILSRERRGNASSPSGNQTSCGGGSFTELDIEKGREETSQT